MANEENKAAAQATAEDKKVEQEEAEEKPKAKRGRPPKNKAASTSKKKAAEPKEETETLEETETVKKKPAKKKVLKIPKDEEFKLVSNTNGVLYYRNRTGSVEFELDSYGDYEYVTMETLTEIKNAHKRFYTDNWIMIEGNDNFTSDEVYKYLRVDGYYVDRYTADDIEELFDKSDLEIRKIISKYPESYKQTLYYIVKQAINDRKLTDYPKIQAFEHALGRSFSENK